MHQKNANKTYCEKGRLRLPKNALCCREQIQEATPHKIAIVRASYLLSNKPFKYNEQDMLGTSGEIRMNLSVTFLWTLAHECTNVGQPANT